MHLRVYMSSSDRSRGKTYEDALIGTGNVLFVARRQRIEAVLLALAVERSLLGTENIIRKTKK